MQVVKATKRFRQVTLLMSMLMGIVSIICLVLPSKGTCVVDIQAAMGMVFALWCLVFFMLFLQVIGMVKCLKKYKNFLFGFYIYVVVTVYVSQMMLWGSGGSDQNNCRTQRPAMWYWLIINVSLFYLMVVFGMATWGSYLCRSADAKEEIINSAVEEYMESGVYKRKQLLLTAGSSDVLAIDAQKNQNEILMIQGGQQQNQQAIQPLNISGPYVSVPAPGQQMMPQLGYQPQSVAQAPQPYASAYLPQPALQVDIEAQNRSAQIVIQAQPNQVIVTDQIARAAYGENYKQMKIPEVVELD